MATSQNGYKSRDYSLIATYTVVRDVKLSLRKGDASVVLLHWARWFDKHIEPLTKVDCGGYNPRTIEGSKTDSNHASGTAEDLNWRKHVRGKKNTFTAAQQKKIRAQLKFYEGVIRWGGDYKVGTVDDMHFEINKGKTELARIARKCKESDKPAQPKPPADPTDVKVDGVLGPKTIKKWQTVMDYPRGHTGVWSGNWVQFVQTFLKGKVDHRLKVDGSWGPDSIRALQRYLKAPVDGFISEPKSKTIVALQRRLNTEKF
jgi:D-alanyl-D-alanine carboxypeptidase